MKNIKALKNKKGFTLVELVIVIAILAIIAAIAIPLVSGQIAKANAATDASNAQAYTTAVKLATAQWELKPADRLAAYTTAFTGVVDATPEVSLEKVLQAAGTDTSGAFVAKQNGYIFTYDAASGTVKSTKGTTGGLTLTSKLNLSTGVIS